jgi:hypothetical protein
VRIERDQPTRSAITVADIVGNALNNSRIRGSKTSTDEPAGARWYFGGPSDANADRTVFLEIPNTRAICEIDMFSARCNRRTSAQSSTPNTRFLPARRRARLSAKLVNIGLPRPVQFSIAVDTLRRSPLKEMGGVSHRMHRTQSDLRRGNRLHPQLSQIELNVSRTRN